MKSQKWLKFNGLTSCVSTQADPRFYEALHAVFSNWHFETLSNEPVVSFVHISFKDGQYTISSPFMSAPEVFYDPVNALCRLVVELAWQQLRERPELLCLHAAAVEMNGRLVVFPSTRRAGKSTLCLGLVAAGVKLYTDDFLPLQITDDNVITGVAQGISPRVRLPLPDQVGTRTEAFFNNQWFIRNKQYQYVLPGSGNAALNGDTSPIGALVFLERCDGAKTQIEKLDTESALAAIIRQNFSRAMNASAILQTLSALAKETPAYKLTYDQVDPAVDALKNFFGDWQDEIPTTPARDISPAPIVETPDATVQPTLADWQDQNLIQMPGTTQTILENRRFLSGHNNRTIVHLNEGAACIWHLLAEPISLAEIIEVLSQAFPDQTKAQIENDTHLTLKGFVQSSLVTRADVQVNSGDGFGQNLYNKADACQPEE